MNKDLKQNIIYKNNGNFLILQLQYNTPFLNKIYSNDTYEIYNFNIVNFTEMYLKQHDIISNYYVFSDIVLNKVNNSNNLNKFVFNILLVKTNISIIKPCTKYEKVMQYGNGYLWRPVCSSTETIYTNLGLVYNSLYPQINYYTIDMDYIKHYDIINSKFNMDGIVISNEYNMFVSSFDELLTIDFVKVKLLNVKYINNNIKKQNAYNENDYDQYNNAKLLKDGRFEINNKCLTNDENKIDLKDCVNVDNAEWEYNGKNIINKSGFKIVKSNSENTIHLQKERNSITPSTNPINSEGKYVVLTTSDNPWYLNKDSTTLIEPTMNNEIENDYLLYVPTRKHLLQQNYKMQPYNSIEFFDNTSNKNKYIKIIILIVLISIIGIIFYVYMNDYNVSDSTSDILFHNIFRR
jgi:hypothetical protein